MASGRKKRNAADSSGNVFHLIDVGSLFEQLSNPLLDANEDAALDKAKLLVDEAAETPSKKKRIALAKKAIKTSALCADAYLLLAREEQEASEPQLHLLERAEEAGRLAIGSSFEQLKGEFWGWIETRPFMRAKLCLANCLWERNERETALRHLREMLILNPNDNQGIRSVLAASLLEDGLNEELVCLLKAYKNDASADLAFSRALVSFRLHGDNAKSRRALRLAIGQNAHVRSYIIGAKKLPKTLPHYYSPGDRSEAVHYAVNFQESWDMTPGAVEWLRGVTAPVESEVATPLAKRRAANTIGAGI